MTAWLSRLWPGLLVVVAVGLGACDRPGDGTRHSRESAGADMERRTYSDQTDVLWSVPVPGSAMNAVAPEVADGVAYVAAGRRVMAIGAETGAMLWTLPLDEPPIGVNRSLGARNLVLDSARVYLAHFGDVVAVDRATGDLVWHTAIPDFDGVDLQHLAENGRHLLVGGMEEAVRLRMSDGAVDLRLTVQPPGDVTADDAPARVFHPALTDDGRIVLPTYTRIPGQRATVGEVRVYDNGGNLTWSAVTKRPRFPTPDGDGEYTAGGGVNGAHVRGTQVLYSTGQTIVARSLSDGRVAWRTVMRDHGFGTPPASDGRVVVIGSTTGRLFGLAAMDGQERWHRDVEGGMLVPPRFDSGMAYQIDDGYGVLYAVDAESGDVVWRRIPPEQRQDRDATYRTPPGIGESVLVVVGSKRIYGLRRVRAMP